MRTGDKCLSCLDGILGVYCSRERGDTQIHYLRCDRCGATNKSTVPAEFIRRRRKRTVRPN